MWGAEKSSKAFKYWSALMSELHGVSIVVVNYNNEQFLGAAIDSALNQDWPVTEVFVVDDCSTDASRKIIERYGDKVRPIFLDRNVHQLFALNAAWPLARYDIVFFLDSDDMLLPNAASVVASSWGPTITKWQFLLSSVDRDGNSLGHVFPKFAPNLDTRIIHKELLRAGAAPSSPGSGNAYAKWFLEQIKADGGFELDSPRDYWMDCVLECNASFYGEVITLHKPLACYRVHESNLTMQDTIEAARFEKIRTDFMFKLEYLRRVCRVKGVDLNVNVVANRALFFSESRLAAAKLFKTESVMVTLFHTLLGCATAPISISQKLVRGAWACGVALLPKSASKWLVNYRYVVTRRPKWFEQVLKWVKVGGE
jgi:glycosyltransferase involved in cell wall biosynthesis